MRAAEKAALSRLAGDCDDMERIAVTIFHSSGWPWEKSEDSADLFPVRTLSNLVFGEARGEGGNLGSDGDRRATFHQLVHVGRDLKPKASLQLSTE